MNIRTNGTAVTGTYHGVTFEGVVESGRPSYIDTYEIVVSLNKPISVMGTIRHSILVSVSPSRDWMTGNAEHATIRAGWHAESVKTTRGYSLLLGGVTTLVHLPEAWANKAVQLLNAITGTADQRAEMQRITAAVTA